MTTHDACADEDAPLVYFDVLVVGAGISGIAAAHHLQALRPEPTFAIFEARDSLGGTWDLFRYPGVRSDSDMYTLGFSFRPWTGVKAIADGPSILNYLRKTAHACGIDRRIRYGRRVTHAAWDSARSRWTVSFQEGPDQTPRQVSCGFLFMCAGYYDYARGHRPAFPGEDRFAGKIVHPQAWTTDLDCNGKRVVVIGSGATAMTLVPSLAESAAHVTMLQRSPGYVISRPSEDALASLLRHRLPARLGGAIVRWRYILLQMFIFNLARRRPAAVKARLIEMTRRELGPDYDIATHFTPKYDPWDQRLCLTPDADLFDAIRTGKASVVTGEIDAFTEAGIGLKSGAMLAADLIITATGLEVQLMGGLALSVDGAPVDLTQAFGYKAMMFSGVPNLASTFGYASASWTLKAELTAAYVCRLLRYMRRHGFTECRPINSDTTLTPAPWMDFTSGYVVRGIGRFPRQGSKAPWRVGRNYLLDLIAFRLGRLNDGVMRFSRPSSDRVR